MRKFLFRLLVGSVLASALVACYALLFGDWSETEQRIVGTCLCVSAISVQTLACAVALERRRLGPLPWAGVAASVLGFGMMIVSIWADIEEADYIRTMGSFIIVSTAIGHASMIARDTVKPRFRWAVVGAYGTAIIGVLLSIGMIWEAFTGEGVSRVLGADLVLLTAFTILVPVFQRVSRSAERPAVCPTCGQPWPDAGASGA
ncbi:MAG: hypothetical protein ACYTGN_01245 [Planctomycetota bacterium]